MLVDLSSIDMSSRTSQCLSAGLHARRRETGARRRRLPAGRQALPASVHLRCGDACAQPGGGFRNGIATVRRRIRVAVDVPAALAPAPTGALKNIRTTAFVILDGTLPPIDRISADTPYCSGKHKRHGVNVQVLTDPFGRLLWASPSPPGSVHGLTAARTHGITDTLAAAEPSRAEALGGTGVAGHPVRDPLRDRRPKRRKRRHNSSHAKIRCRAEQTIAALKSRWLLRKPRRSTNRNTTNVQAVLVLHHTSA
ncbi:transposase family protein [Streptomyces sp. NPDC001787]|uniref:transposase family protein n=1 Tax=Streptomyces sp. NPDC001787 TaxID=3154523 RepID=UPI00331A816F